MSVYLIQVAVSVRVRRQVHTGQPWIDTLHSIRESDGLLPVECPKNRWRIAIQLQALALSRESWKQARKDQQSFLHFFRGRLRGMIDQVSTELLG